MISCQHLKLHVGASGVSYGGTTVSMSVWTKQALPFRKPMGGFTALT